MSRAELQMLLEQEMRAWSTKPIPQLVDELIRSVGYERGVDESWHQFEVNLLEDTQSYVHVGVCIDDGSPEWNRTPLSSSFIVYRDGRIEL